MLKKSLLGLLFCLLCISRLSAADITVKADNITAHSQTQQTSATLPISINSDVDATSLQFDLYLPTGFKFKSVANGAIANTSHVVTSSAKDGYTRILLYSSQNQVFKAQSGVVLNITLDVDTALASKDYDVALKNIYVSDASTPANRYGVSDQRANISVTTLAEKVTLSEDFMEVGIGSSRQLAATVYPTYTTNKSVKWSSGNESFASVADGLVTGVAKGLTDVKVTTDDGSNVSAVCHTYSGCYMVYADNVSAHSQSTVQTVTIPVQYNANADNSGLQFDLYLPAGFKFKSVAKGAIANTNHMVTSSVKDGYTRILLYSSQNQVFKSQSGVALNITLDVDTALASRDYDVALKDIYVSDASTPANRYGVSDQRSTISVTTLAEKVTLSENFMEVGIGSSKQLSATVYPTYTTNKSVKWSSGNESFASVADGLVTGVAKGLTDVKVTTDDGSNVSAVCHTYSGCYMVYADNVSAHSQSTVQTVTIPVQYNANADNSGLQFDLYLPTGFKFKSVEKGAIANTSHVATYSAKDGYTRILLYSSQNQVFKAQSGVALNITLDVDTALASKDYDVALKNIYVSNASTPANRYEVSEQHNTIAISTLAEKIFFTSPYTVLRLKEKSALTPIVLPAYTTDKNIILKSSDNSTVGINGNEAESLKQGLVTVTAETQDGSNLSATQQVYSECSMLYADNRTEYSQSSSREIKVPVILKAFNNISHIQFDLYLPDGISLISTEKAGIATNKHVLTAEPKEGFIRILCYTSDNSAFSNTEGEVLYLNLGVPPQLTAKKYNAWFKNTNLTTASSPTIRYEMPDWSTSFDVSTLVESITLNKDTMNLYDGQSEKLTVALTPDFATIKTLKWRSLNTSLANVDANGLVTVTGDGTTKAIVSTTDGSNLSDTCVIIVKPVLATGLTMSIAKLTLEDQCAYQMSCKISPDNVTYTKLTWSSDDTSVAQVDATGYVVAKKVGSTIIRVKTTDGTMLCDSCELTVVPLLIKELSFSTDTVNIGKECEFALNVTINPDNATDKSLQWKSLDETIATVDEYGLIKGLSNGTTKIVASSVTNPTVQGECTVIVHDIETTIGANILENNILQLNWGTMYNKNDIADYNVYVSENNAPFYLWMPNTTATSATFKLKDGVSYRFLVTSRDMAGNIELYNEENGKTIK